MNISAFMNPTIASNSATLILPRRPPPPAQAARTHTFNKELSIAPDYRTSFNNPAAKMAPTIEELDATVRAFYESRGESVSIPWVLDLLLTGLVHLLTRPASSKK